MRSYTLEEGGVDANIHASMPYTVTSAKAFGTAASKGPLLLRCMVGADIMVFAGVELEEARDAVRKGTQDFKVVTPPPPVRIPLDLRKWW